MPNKTNLDLSALAEMEYPGRVIIIGTDKNGIPYAAYGLSGRSESSQARRLRYDEEGAVCIEVTDPEQLEKGDPALLVYNAVAKDGDTVIVSNGAQTDLIKELVKVHRDSVGKEAPLESLLPMAFSKPYKIESSNGREIDLARYEPDAPNFTPRISGVLRGYQAVLCIVKKDPASQLPGDLCPSLKYYFEFGLTKGQGRMIATYTGINENPLPSFAGEPKDVVLDLKDPQEIAHAVYEAMGVFKVSAACYTLDKRLGIVNKHDKGGE